MAEKIGQILIRKGKIDSAQLREALRTQQFFGGYLGSHLINLGFIDEASLGETLSEIYRVPFAPFDSIRTARAEVTVKVPATLAQRFRVVPIQIEGNRLHLAMLNPRDAVAINEVSAATGLNVTPWVAPEFRIIQALEKHYRMKKAARGPIKIREKVIAHEPIEEEVEEISRAPVDYRKVEVGVVGLDGHLLSATVVPEVGDSRPAITPPAHMIPRSLQEWREETADLPQEPGGRRKPPPPAEEKAQEAPPGAGLDQLGNAMVLAGSRDDLAREVLRFLSGRFHRAAIFTVRQDVVSGWMAEGDGLDPDSLRKMQARLGDPFFSVFSPESETYTGPIAGDSAGHEFCALPDGRVPPAVLLVKVIIRERLVTILYADNEHELIGAIDVSLYTRLARMMGVGLEIMILKHKMKQI